MKSWSTSRISKVGRFGGFWEDFSKVLLALQPLWTQNQQIFAKLQPIHGKSEIYGEIWGAYQEILRVLEDVGKILKNLIVVLVVSEVSWITSAHLRNL